MSKRTPPPWGVLLALMLALAGCQSVTPQAATDAPVPTTPPPTAAPTVPPSRQPTPTAGATTQAESTAPPLPTPIPGATSAPRPTPRWQIPMVEEGEWVSGPEDAGLTIVEYSDFQ